MNIKDLPEGWIEGKLGKLIRVSSGVGFPKKFQGKSIGDYPVYKVSDVSKAVTTNTGYLDTAGHYVDREEAVELKGEVFPIGTTLFAKIGEAVKLNRRAFVLKPGLADNNVMAALPDIKESNRFIYSFMRTVDLSDISRSTTVPSVRKGDIEEIVLSIPPLAEQKVIADKLDTLLTQVETTKAHLERIPKILKTFRQSVLAAAVSGKLVTVSEPNVTTVGCVTTDIRYGTSKKCGYDAGQTPVIRIPNIGDRRINLSDLKYADFTEKELEALALKAGDILVIRSNGSLDLVAKPALVDQKSEGFLYAGYLIRLRCNEEKVLPSFLLNVMSSRVVRDIVEITSRSTSGVNNINSKELASLKFVLPSIVEQTEIVRRVEELFTFADSIEQKANAALERVNNLTQSILAKAFRGELTADWRAANPELITGENSAEALLERIKAEREASSNKKPAVRKTRARKEA
ncbi:restriction endonuclease subunit S [Serratia marcescens]|uniref:restriction endonuclease subunit S n=1 Tax=Serratia marcescens TaxID=615 RepID=UPI000665C81B|nr:restriction endonuclease subunit S [Serratia marcescens]